MLRRRHAFTLIEILVAITVLAIIIGIALPNFLKARETARTRQCVTNLQRIDSALTQWAIDNHASGNTTPPTLAELCGSGTTTYLRTTPSCPLGGSYAITSVTSPPTCSIGGLHITP